MTALISQIATERSADLRRRAESHRRARFGRKARAARRAAEAAVADVTVRRLDHRPADRAALDYLADLDSSEPLTGEVLGAELDGALVAAISLETGDLVSDPFVRTDEIRSLLELRASQLRGHGARRHRRPHLPSALRRTARAA